MGRPAEVTAEVTTISGMLLKPHPPGQEQPVEATGLQLSSGKEAARPQGLPGGEAGEARDADRLPLSSKDAGGVSSHCQAL